MNVVFLANYLWNPSEQLLSLPELEIEDSTSMESASMYKKKYRLQNFHACYVKTVQETDKIEDCTRWTASTYKKKYRLQNFHTCYVKTVQETDKL